MQVSGHSDIDGMVDKFIHIEDQNFALFNFVKEQSREIQASDSSTESLNQQIKLMHEADVHMESKHKTIKKSMEEKDTLIAQCNTHVNDQLKVDHKSLDSVCIKIEQMLGSVKCDRSAMTELLAGSRITHDNLTSYLGLIEQKGSEMLQARSLIQLRKTDEGGLSGGNNANNKDGTNHGQGGTDIDPISFATVGRIARYLTRMPSLMDDMPDAFTNGGANGAQEVVHPLTQREARTLLIARTARLDAMSNSKFENANIKQQ